MPNLGTLISEGASRSLGTVSDGSWTAAGHLALASQSLRSETSDVCDISGGRVLHIDASALATQLPSGETALLFVMALFISSRPSPDSRRRAHVLSEELSIASKFRPQWVVWRGAVL